MELSKFWWKEDEKEIYRILFAHLSYLEKNQLLTVQEDKDYIRLYGNNDIIGFYPKSKANFKADRLKFNIIKSICDTATSKITKNKVKPTFLTKGGDWSKQNKAKKLEKYVLGQFYKTKFYEKSAIVFLNTTVLGTGCLKIYRIGTDIYLDRVMKPELFIDYADGIYGDPRSLFHVKHFHREVLYEMFPDFEKQIKDSGKGSYEEKIYGSYYEDSKTDLIKVIEAWHLPSGKEAKDGRHTIAIDNATILDEPYERNYFPFSFMKWTHPQYGFWGTGISQILMGIQVEINKILKENQDIFHLMDIPQVWLQSGSKIVSSHFNNQIGTVHNYTGELPQPMTMGKISQERFSYIQWLIQSAYELAGISQMSAQSKIPAYELSGKAVRTYRDIETERFATVERGWENFTLEVVRQILDLSEEIGREEKGFKILVGCGKTAEELKWSDINLSCDDYIMQVYPTNLLADEPASRLSDVRDLMQAGLYTPEQGRKLLDFPDTEALNSILNADQEDIERLIEHFIEKDEYIPPEPFQNLSLGLQMIQKAYLKAKMNNVPEERLENFRQWMSDADHLFKEMARPPEMSPAGVMGLEGSPLAKPTPSPTNELIENVPAMGTMQ